MIRSIIELEQTCPNHRHIIWLLQPYEKFQSVVIMSDGSFDCESFPVLLDSNRFDSSYGVKLPSPQ